MTIQLKNRASPVCRALSKWPSISERRSPTEQASNRCDFKRALATTRFLNKDLKLRLVPREVKVLLVIRELSARANEHISVIINYRLQRINQFLVQFVKITERFSIKIT